MLPAPVKDFSGKTRIQAVNGQPTMFNFVPAVKNESGLSRSTIYLRIKEGLWPKPVSLGPRAVGWPSNEVKAINDARIAGKSDTEIRKLVSELEKARKILK